jgi:SAM-dependent MidA family methyltransferase
VTSLADRLRERIRSEGPIAFSEYMNAALYDPEDGYYADPSFTTGREGDFATAPDTGPLMGATLAEPIEAFAEQGSRLVELGPGSGRLVTDVLDQLSEEARQRLEVVLVEPFEARQQALADRVEEDTGHRPRVVGDLEPVEPGRTFLLANEVLDALPVDVLAKTEDGLDAMHVDLDDGDGFVEVWQPAEPPLAEAAAPVAPRLPEGGRYELSRGLEELLRSVAGTLDPGVAAVFDYGGRFDDLWGQGSSGTLRAFREHQHAEMLEDPGEVDLTADVDFSRVMGLADALGLAETAYGGQDRLLVHLGLVEVARQRDRMQEVKQLLVPSRSTGFGERFRALVLDRGGVADTLDLAVDLDDPDVWTRAMEDMGGEEGLAGLGAEELF